MATFYYNGEIARLVEIVKDKLYFGVLSGTMHKILRNTADVLYLNIDEELIYINFYYDFGPLNISCLYKYCCKLNSYLHGMQGFKRIIHYTTSDPCKRVNSAFLIGSFAIIYLKMDPRTIYKILLKSGGKFKDFVDASQGISLYTITLLDTLQAIAKASALKFFEFSDFNVFEYDTQDKIQNGDMNWLLPRKYLAFIGPMESNDSFGHPPEFYINYFLKNDVKTVIRLNNKLYNADIFTQKGIEHFELFFPDGTIPPKEVLVKFLSISESAPAGIAVHCKAGLGRTGSLIGAYIIKHYRLSAKEAIAWMRICRPGSVIGQQQGWLEKIESWLWRQGSQYRLRHFGEGDKIPQYTYGIYSIEWPKRRQMLLRKLQIKSAEVQARFAKLDPERLKKINSATDKYEVQQIKSRRVPRREYDKKKSHEYDSEFKQASKTKDVQPKLVQNSDLRNRRLQSLRNRATNQNNDEFIEHALKYQVTQPKIFLREPNLTNQIKVKNKSSETVDNKKGNTVFPSWNLKQGKFGFPTKNGTHDSDVPVTRNENLKRDVKTSTHSGNVKNEDFQKIKNRSKVVERTQGDLLNMMKLKRRLIPTNNI